MDQKQNSKASSDSSYYKAFVGPSENYDYFGCLQFNLLTFLGLREHHYLLDIGCGSLRAGKLFIPYLKEGRYFGIDPEKWLIDEGIKKETGMDMIEIKKPRFSENKDFTLSVFDQKFDFIMAHSIFSHATESQIDRCLSQASEVMEPAGIFAATFFEGDDNYAGQKWTLKAEYTFRHMQELANKNRLECRSIDWPSPDLQRWVLFVRKDFSGEITAADPSIELIKLKNELRFHKERLSKIENHPYVKLGFKISYMIRTLGFAVRRGQKQ